MHVLVWRGQPIACANRWERLAEQMALYTQAQQEQMQIVAVEELT